MKRTYIAAALIAGGIAAPATAADYYIVSGDRVPVGSYQVVQINDQATVSLVQQRLNQAGYNVRSDGIMDAHTREALAHFQQANGYAATGLIDAPTLSALGLNRSAPMGGSGSVGSSTTVIYPATGPSAPRNYEGSIGDGVGHNGFEPARIYWNTDRSSGRNYEGSPSNGTGSLGFERGY